MKKLYTLAIATLVALGASATAPISSPKEVTPFGKVTIKAEQATLSAPTQSPAAKVKRNAEGDDMWTVLGTGKMVEGFASSTIAGDPQTLDVTIEKSKLQRGVYRISKPYANYVCPIPAVTYTDSIATPMIIHAEDPTAVWIESFKTGLSYSTTYVGGEISHQAESLLANYPVATIK